MKVKIHSPKGNTDFFDIITDVLQGDTLTPIPVHNLLRLRTLRDLMKENGFTQQNARSR